MKMAYNVTGEKRKDLVTAVSEIVGWSPVYKKAPTFAYVVNNYIIDKEGNLTGRGSISDDDNAKLLRTLEERGFCGNVVEFGEAVSEPHDAERGAKPAGVEAENQMANPKFAMRTYLNRIGLIGAEFKNCREHLCSYLSGNGAFRYGIK